MTNFVHSLNDLVGHTPLIKLQWLSDQLNCNIFGKCEFLNGGGSIKDRAVQSMLREAKLPPNSLIVEATAGNTGSALCQLSKAHGHRVILTCPDKVASTKILALRALGAQVVVCPSVKGTDERHFQQVAQRLAREQSAFYLNQFENVANALGHYNSTGPELIEQLGEAALDSAVVALCTGTGGTLAGVGKALFEANGGRRAMVAMATRGQSVVFDGEHFVTRTDEEKEAEGSSELEGVGSGRLYGNLKSAEPYVKQGLLAGATGDYAAAAMCRLLANKEGLFVGGSAGMNVCTAVVTARLLGPGCTVVTMLCDGGERCALSRDICPANAHSDVEKQFSDEWCTEKGMPTDEAYRNPNNLTFLNDILALNQIKEFFE